MLQLNPTATSIFSVFIILSLLLNFVIIGSRWIINYVFAFAMEAWIIGFIALGIGYFSHDTDLYIVGLFTVLFRGCVFPYFLLRMVKKMDIKRELHSIIPATTSLFLSILLVVFCFVIATQLTHKLGITDNLIVLALIAMLSIKSIGFLLLAIRDEAISKILALLVLENGVFLGSLFIVPGIPLFIELVILFDLMVAIACFSVLMNHLKANVGSTSAAELNKLVG